MKIYLSSLLVIVIGIFGWCGVALGDVNQSQNCTDPNDPETCYYYPDDIYQQINTKQTILSDEPTEAEIEAAEKEMSIKLKKEVAGLNPLNITDPSDIFRAAINAMMAFIGSISLILYIYAGFIWMSAGGNTEKVSKAKSILVWTTLGVVAMGGSYMIVRIVLENIGG